MNPHAKRALEVEEAFLAGAEANLNQARGARLPGSAWAWRTDTQDERIRRWMAENRQSDRSMLRSVPKNRTRTLTGSQRRWLIGRKVSGVAIASALSPIEHYLEGDGEPPPVGLADLAAHVKQLTGEAEVPHLVGVCSPSGFTEDARSSGLELPNVTLVLVEPRKDGGWTVTGTSPDARPADLKLFDPEAVTQKLARVREEIEARGADLLTGGLSASAIAAELELPVRLVALAFEHAAGRDAELKVSGRSGHVLLFRGAPASLEDDDMSMIDRLRQLLTGEGNEEKKINVLSERRARLVQRRDRIYKELTGLEKREASLLEQGRATPSPSARRRAASQIKQLRDDMQRLDTTAKMLGQQVEVIATHIHNLTLIQQGQTAKLPSQEELADDAVRAEELIERLGADSELASSLTAGGADVLTSDEELAILAELEGTAPQREAAKPSPADTSRAAAKDTVQDKEPKRREPEAG